MWRDHREQLVFELDMSVLHVGAYLVHRLAWRHYHFRPCHRLRDCCSHHGELVHRFMQGAVLYLMLLTAVNMWQLAKMGRWESSLL